jgi:zinc transport system permease protein
MEGEAAGWAAFWDAFDLFRDAIVCAVAAGVTLGFLGVYIVLRRMVFVSAAVTQSAGLGVALSFFAAIHLGVTVDPVYGATGAALVASLLFIVDPHRARITRESVLGWVYALTGGAAVIVGSRISQEAHDINAIIFGSAVLVRPFDLGAVLVVSAAVLALHLWWFRGLTFASFDPDAARVQRLPVALLGAVILVSVGLTVGVAARALGALPVFAFSTMPATAALLLGGRRLGLTFLTAALIGGASGVLGYLAAFFHELPVGAAQTAVATAFVALAAIARGALSLLSRWRTHA